MKKLSLFLQIADYEQQQMIIIEETSRGTIQELLMQLF